MREKTLHTLALEYLATMDNEHFVVDVLVSKEAMQEFIADMRASECFDFGDLHLELATDGVNEKGENIVFHAPKLTLDEMGFWHEGLIPLPAPVCWYEFSINGIRSGLLIKKAGKRTLTQRVEYAPVTKTTAPKLYVDGLWTYVEPGDNATRFHSVNEEALIALKRYIGNEVDPLVVESMGGSREIIDDKAAFIAMSYAVNPYLMIYLTLMINSQTTEVRKVAADAASNRLRRLRGKPPVNGHTVVTIVPKRFIIDTPNGEHRTGSHKRLHWRRSHIRVLRRDTPMEKRIVIPRFLVGRRELGEVTHEYRVRSE